jgi:hypothetical protein
VAVGGKIQPSTRGKIVALVIGALVLFGLAELALSTLPSIGGERLFHGVIYFPPQVSREAYANYLKIRDPVVGWPAPGSSGADATGKPLPRPSPAFPDARQYCLTTYGDSFTYGDEVTDEQAWANVLARRLGCAVGNFGIGGYGTDQALLRARANTGDNAPSTVLGLHGDNTLRNVNRYRYFLTGGEALALKPRFIVDNGVLTLIPLLNVSYEEFQRGLKRPASLFHHEVFVPGSRNGPVAWGFPYTLGALNIARSDHFINYVRQQPSWINFHDPNHHSRGLPTTIAIIEEFARLARERGKSSMVMLFQSPAGYNMAKRTGTSPLENLRSALHTRGIHVHDVTEDFATYLGGRSFCEVLVSPRNCTGHHSPEGNEVLAKVIETYLRQDGLIR